jgi:YggT family protein
MSVVATLVSYFFQLLTLLVLVAAILSFFMPPYHPVREFVDRLVDPMLRPIRRILPPMGGLDFSPVVLIILLQVVGGLITRLLRSF